MATSKPALAHAQQGETKLATDVVNNTDTTVGNTLEPSGDLGDGAKAAAPQIPQEATPLPLDQLVCVLFIQLCEALNVNVLFPFMAFMVEDFGYEGEELGYYVGTLAAAFCTAQFFSSVFWGRMSDVYGRKPSIIIGTAGTVVGMMLFGLAGSYSQAVCGRFLAGLLSGNIGVLKTYVTEITDDSNRAAGFAYCSLAWAVGCIVAPLFGGMLSNPADKYPAYFSSNGLFAKFPYFLPILLCVILLVVSIVICLLFMKETNDKLINRSNVSKQQEIELSSVKSKSLLEEGTTNVIASTAENEYVTVTLNEVDEASEAQLGDVECPGSGVDENGGDDEDDNDDDEECFFCSSKIGAAWSPSRPAVDQSKSPMHTGLDNAVDRSSHALIEDSALKPKRRNPLTRRLVVLSCCNYMVLCMSFILFDETLPLYLKLSTQQGGFSFSSMDIGWLLSATGGFLMVWAAFVLPRVGRYSKKAVFHYGLVIAIGHVLLWPLSGSLNYALLQVWSPALVEWIMYPLLFVLLSLKAAMASCCFMASTIQVNHSVYTEDLGTVNGFGQALGALARGVGPALGGVLWSTSTSLGFVYLNFFAVAALWAVNMAINSMLPKSLDMKKVRKADRNRSHRCHSTAHEGGDDHNKENHEAVVVEF